MSTRKKFLDICKEEFGESVETTQSVSEGEVEYLKEEANKQDVDISKDIAAIEELIEEQNIVNDQIQKNEEKLTNPDIVVVAADVEVSEECYKNTCYRLKYKSSSTLKFSNESIFNAVHAEPRKYLAVSNEFLKEVVFKIWEEIKELFREICKRLKIKEKFAILKDKLNREKSEGILQRLEDTELISIESNNEKDYWFLHPFLALVLGDKDIIAAVFSQREYMKTVDDISKTTMNALSNKNYGRRGNHLNIILKKWSYLKEYLKPAKNTSLELFLMGTNDLSTILNRMDIVKIDNHGMIIICTTPVNSGGVKTEKASFEWVRSDNKYLKNITRENLIEALKLRLKEDEINKFIYMVREESDKLLKAYGKTNPSEIDKDKYEWAREYGVNVTYWLSETYGSLTDGLERIGNQFSNNI